jgi:hypothetical protein
MTRDATAEDRPTGPLVRLDENVDCRRRRERALKP